MNVDVVVDARADVGEGPVWDSAAGRLLWVDITARRVHVTDPVSGNDQSFMVPEPVGALAMRQTGGLVMALESGFWTVNTDGSHPHRVAPIETAAGGLRMNDGKCDGAGRFWAGSTPYDGRPRAAALYRLDADGSVRTMLTGVSLSNGLGWSHDDRRMYYVDTPTQRVDTFDFDLASGEIANRRPLLELPAERGAPDGLCVDADGCLWVALWGGGVVLRCSPVGKIEREVRLPVRQVTSCAFGGPGLDELYITSAAHRLSKQELANEPHAGALFVCHPGVTGLPGNIWAG